MNAILYYTYLHALDEIGRHGCSSANSVTSSTEDAEEDVEVENLVVRSLLHLELYNVVGVPRRKIQVTRLRNATSLAAVTDLYHVRAIHTCNKLALV